MKKLEVLQKDYGKVIIGPTVYSDSWDASVNHDFNNAISTIQCKEIFKIWLELCGPGHVPSRRDISMELVIKLVPDMCFIKYETEVMKWRVSNSGERSKKSHNVTKNNYYMDDMEDKAAVAFWSENFAYALDAKPYFEIYSFFLDDHYSPTIESVGLPLTSRAGGPIDTVMSTHARMEY